jgi:ATPase subunit of ABC transporter with duplicated ATPase domains
MPRPHPCRPRALLAITAPVRAAGDRLRAAEDALDDTERTQVRYADALVAWGEAGGYTAEVEFDTASVAVLDLPWEQARHRRVATLSGGEQKRFALELLLRGSDEVLLLDEPDNYLDVPGKRWLEARLVESPKSVLFVSHDRELLSAPRTGWSPSRQGRPGPIPRDSRPGTRPGWPVTPASTSCAAAGTRNV